MLSLPALPLIRPTSPSTGTANALRKHGRAAVQLRPLKVRTGVVTSASGSAMLELGQTKVICSIFGPNQADGGGSFEHGQLECSVRLASFARRGGNRAARAGGRSTSAEESALSLDLTAALIPSVQLHLLPKSLVAVHVLVLQDDGGILPAAISCASLALADATISLYSMVAAIGCGSIGETLVLDCDAAELTSSTATTTIACLPTLDQLTLVRQEGVVPLAQATSGLQLGLSGCALLHEEMAAALRETVAAREQEAERPTASPKAAEVEAAPTRGGREGGVDEEGATGQGDGKRKPKRTRGAV